MAAGVRFRGAGVASFGVGLAWALGDGLTLPFVSSLGGAPLPTASLALGAAPAGALLGIFLLAARRCCCRRRAYKEQLGAWGDGDRYGDRYGPGSGRGSAAAAVGWRGPLIAALAALVWMAVVPGVVDSSSGGSAAAGVGGAVLGLAAAAAASVVLGASDGRGGGRAAAARRAATARALVAGRAAGALLGALQWSLASLVPGLGGGGGGGGGGAGDISRLRDDDVGGGGPTGAAGTHDAAVAAAADIVAGGRAAFGAGACLVAVGGLLAAAALSRRRCGGSHDSARTTAVLPHSFSASWEAPARSNSLTTSAQPFVAATWSAVFSKRPRVFTSMPRAIRSRHVSTVPGSNASATSSKDSFLHSWSSAHLSPSYAARGRVLTGRAAHVEDGGRSYASLALPSAQWTEEVAAGEAEVGRESVEATALSSCWAR